MFKRRAGKPRPYKCALILVALGSIALAAPAFAVEQKKIAEAVAQLGDLDPTVREKASRTLWKAGREAEPALLEATKSGDPEIVARAREILIDFKYGIYPDTPADIVGLLQAYRRGNAVQKRAAVSALTQIGPRAYPAAVKLTRAEENSTLRAQVFGELVKLGDGGAVGFLAEGDFKSAQQCLEVALGDELPRPTRSYIAFLLQSGRADEKIAELRHSMERGDGISRSARTLAYLLRGKGDLAGARDAAGHAVDDRLMDGLMTEQADWRTLARMHAGEAVEGASIEKLAFAAAYHRLAAQSEAAARTLKLLESRAAREPQKTWLAAKALLLNDRPKAAIELLIRQDETASAVELLLAQQRFAEALELAANARGPRAVYQARMARTLHQLGEKERAAEALKEAIASAPTVGMEAWVAIVDAELRMRRRDEALAHAALAIALLNDPPGPLFARLFGKNATDAEVWWNVLRARHGGEQLAGIMRRVDALLAGKWAAKDLSVLCREVRIAKSSDQERVLRAALNALEKAGLEDEAQACAEILADGSSDGRELVALAAATIRKSQWQQGAELASRAIARDGTRAAARYLRGHALLQMEREKEGRELMNVALILPLGDDGERYRLAEILQNAGLADAAREQFELLLRVGDFWGSEVANAARILAYRAMERGDHLAAAQLWERSNLPCLRDDMGFAEVPIYLGMPHLVHHARARGLLKSGSIEAAMGELRLCEEYLPGDINLVIEMAGPLREAGRNEELITLVERTLRRQEKILESYPKAANIHNSAAWMLARCRLKLDVGLVHALKAVELEPSSAAILDTLGEVYFQLGQKEKAVAAMHRCIELEPGVERFKVQLKRIEEGKVDSPPPP